MVTGTRITPEIDAIRTDIYKAWKEATAKKEFKDIDELRGQNALCQSLWGAYMSISRVIGVVSDKEWQKFLKGEK